MRAEALSPLVRQRVSELVAAKTGLHFPPERHLDLERGLADAANESGFATTSEYADWLLSTALAARELQSLASHLTIGETYFFRERPTFAALATHVLPELIAHQRTQERRLRLWSAACSSGEEAYSLAILLRDLIPDIEDWRVSILGTDINPRFLARARQGEYGEWSFRDCTAGFRERHFDPVGEKRYAVKSAIRRLVSFTELNLASDGFPSLATDTNAMDVILCRNVLIYFTPDHTRALIEKLRRALVEDGWLITSPSECSQAVFHAFTATNYPGAILYRKRAPRAAPWLMPVAVPQAALPPVLAAPLHRDVPKPAAPAAPAASLASQAQSLFDAGRFAEVANLIDADTSPSTLQSLLARALANLGRLKEAAHAIEHWLTTDKLNATAHYLDAMIRQELGDADAARRSLTRSVYLEPGFALAHFALGNLARGTQRGDEARRHYDNALVALETLAPDALVPESDGLTAARLTEILQTLAVDDSRRVSEH
jgi:chemotaxis protein methyltransferase CheR